MEIRALLGVAMSLELTVRCDLCDRAGDSSTARSIIQAAVLRKGLRKDGWKIRNGTDRQGKDVCPDCQLHEENNDEP